MGRSTDSAKTTTVQTAANVFFRQTLFAPPAAFAVEAEGEGYLVTIPVAVCSQHDRVVSLVTEMCPAQMDGISAYELSFSILVVSESGSYEAFLTQERNMARPYLPGGVPDLIMPLVCASIHSLVENVKPAFIYRVTKGASLPPKALEKHHMVTGAVQSCGYTVCETGTDPCGRTFWLMEKSGT